MIDDKLANQYRALQSDIIKLCNRYDANLALIVLTNVWEGIFCDLFSDKIEVEKILEEYLIYQRKRCEENIYNTGDFTLPPFCQENDLLKKIENLQNVMPESYIFKVINKITVKDERPEYPYKISLVPIDDEEIVN